MSDPTLPPNFELKANVHEQHGFSLVLVHSVEGCVAVERCSPFCGGSVALAHWILLSQAWRSVAELATGGER
jgi:hypothetical protein